MSKTRSTSPSTGQASESRRLSSLLEVSQALSGTLNMRSALHRVLEILAKHHGTVRSMVTLLQDNGDLIVSEWVGYIYYVYANGQTELLLDTHNEKKNTADIGYDPVKKIIYVPTFFDKRVVAYQLK